MTRIYAQAPMEGCPSYITPGEHYEVLSDRGSMFDLRDDEGDVLTCVWKGSVFLNGGNWTRIEEGAEEAVSACIECQSAARLHVSSDREVAWVKCDGCGREGPPEYKDETAIARWNAGEARVVATPDPRETRIAELEAALRAICDMQRLHYGNGTRTHMALIGLCDDARAKLTGDKS